MKGVLIASCVAVATLSHVSYGQSAAGKVDVLLSSGDVIRGVLVSNDGKNVVVDHPVLGRITLAIESVGSVSVVGDAAVPPSRPADPVPAKPVEPEKPAGKSLPDAKAPPAEPTSFWRGWKSTAEVGLNGAEGNSTSISLRAAINTRRETSRMVTTFNASYNYGSQDSEKNLERGELNARNDWKLDGAWRLYATGKAEYDQFQDWDWRLSGFGGVGYEFVKDEKTLLLGRVGLGASKEFGSSKQRIEPELDLGMDWTRKIDDRQKLFATADFFPSLEHPSHYRANVQTGYEVIVDPEHNFSLKLGLEDRYDSNPGADKKKNDLLYFVTLVTGF